MLRRKLQNTGASPSAQDRPLKSRVGRRRLVEEHGTFIEVFVNTDIDECEKRDQRACMQRQGRVS